MPTVWEAPGRPVPHALPPMTITVPEISAGRPKKKLHGLHADGEDPAIVAVGRPTIMGDTVRGSREAQSGPCLPRSQIKKFTLLCPPNVQSPCTRSLRGQLPKTTPGSRLLRVGISAMCTEVFKGRDFLQPCSIDWWLAIRVPDQTGGGEDDFHPRVLQKLPGFASTSTEYTLGHSVTKSIERKWPIEYHTPEYDGDLPHRNAVV